MWLRNRLSLSREQQRAPDCCWPTFRLLSAPPSRTEFCRKTCSSRRGRATFKSPCPELVSQKFYLHFLFVGFLNKRNPLFSSVQLLSHVQVFVTPWSAAHQASLFIMNSRSLFKLIESVMPCNHLILCHPLLLQPSVFPSISVLSNESGVCIWWPKYWSFSFNISPSDIQD